jgi:hypothetical protein
MPSGTAKRSISREEDSEIIGGRTNHVDQTESLRTNQRKTGLEQIRAVDKINRNFASYARLDQTVFQK